MDYRLRLREFRKLRNLTQAELAESIGVTTRTVGAWERGLHDPDVEQIWKLCKALDVSPNVMLNWNEADGLDAIKKQAQELSDRLNGI